MMANFEDSEDEQPPTPKRFRSTNALKGAATYRSKYNPKWQQEFPCVQPVRDDPHCFYCSVCEKKLACHHSGKTDVTNHLMSRVLKSKAESFQVALRNQSTLSFASSGPLNEKVSAQQSENKRYNLALVFSCTCTCR